MEILIYKHVYQKYHGTQASRMVQSDKSTYLESKVSSNPSAVQKKHGILRLTLKIMFILHSIFIFYFFNHT
jgi:hypothetical protein